MRHVTETIKYIGCDDADIRLFESQYNVPEGMCYNSFVILDEKVAIMDTSDKRTLEQWKKNLTEALGDRKPDYLIVQHLEPDHASGIGDMLAMYPDIQVVCSAKAKTMIPLYFPDSDLADRVIAVKEGDTLELGEHTLTFVMAPMVHWPEVMVTYDAKDKVLFSADGFGKFGVMDADADDWACEARRYYFNICGKYGTPVSTLLKKAAKLDIEQILPLHGPFLSGEKMAEALRLYGIWSSYGVESEGVFIAHASIHGCTKHAAEKLADILRKKGCKKVSITDLCREDIHEAVEDAFKYGKVVFAASSYDAGLFTPMYNFLHLLQAKTWQKRDAAIIENGSWAPSAAKVMTKMLLEMKDINIKGNTVTLRGVMKDSDIPALEALADEILA
ncbi:FprA family A-type flavoprotein [uncultured Prevotella sp.]|uniref:FprA family A-type flavoprotein n=1 Tax=uncultured Prevotella sp. TaxID=159272 RepID=UPI0026356139|nr:FprA family A-type flavoprotein [uncultured Prevotella sp.]